MRDYELLGEWAVYPGHPITIAYCIVRNYPSLAEALAVPEGRIYASALGDNDIPGAGGNVRAALDVLRQAAKDEALDTVFALADDMWGRCDGMKNGGPHPSDPRFGRDHYLKCYKEGQDQADRFKKPLAELLATWDLKSTVEDKE